MRTITNDSRKPNAPAWNRASAWVSRGPASTWLMAFCLCVLVLPIQADTLNTLYPFASSTSMIQASDGNLYGANNAIFKITPEGAYTTLYSFGSIANDGYNPHGALIQASDGNLYGTCLQGGANGVGTIFKITLDGVYTTLYSFGSAAKDGTWPAAGLVQASDGNLYGTCSYGNGSSYSNGTIFKITLGGAYTTLYHFSVTGQNTNVDGAAPLSALIQCADGNLYGTCSRGGPAWSGTVFKITLGGVLTTLHSFSEFLNTYTNSDGAWPAAPLIQATDGNLYGTCSNGGTGDVGTIFKITTGGTLTTLYSLGGYATDGTDPYSGLIQANDGNLYGTCQRGGKHNVGTIFEITTGGAYTTLVSFSQFVNGANPCSGLIQASDGNLYGTCLFGGPSNSGTIFQLLTGPVNVSAIAPTSVQANTAFTLTLHGSNFGQAAVVKWNGKALKTTYVSNGQLTATVTTAVNRPLSAYPGSAQISVVNPDNTSSSMSITITTPMPVLKTLIPASASAGSRATKLTPTGVAFAPGAVVNWNGTALKTTFVASGRLTATIPASDLAKKETAQVSVTNPSGGGTSQSLTFTIK